MKRFQEAMNFFYKKHFNTDGSGSIFFSLFMKVGIVFFSVVKMIQEKPKTKINPESYVLVSNDASLKERLEAKLQKKIQLASLINGKLNISIRDNIEIIFDTNCITFKEVIQFLQENKNNGFTFKLLPANSDYIIGSNSSYDRGEVILITQSNK